MPGRVLYVVPGGAPARAAWMTARAIPGLQLDVKHVNFVDGEHKQDWFLKMNPEHLIPTLDDNGFYLYESRAIMRYLANEYDSEGTLYPRDNKARALVDKMLDRDLALYYKGLGMYVYPQVYLENPKRKEDIPEVDMRAALRSIETMTQIQHGQFICGEAFTLADISIYQSVSYLDLIDFDFSEYPAISAWREKIRAMPCATELNEAFASFKRYSKTPEFKKMAQKRHTKRDDTLNLINASLKQVNDNQYEQDKRLQ